MCDELIRHCRRFTGIYFTLTVDWYIGFDKGIVSIGLGSHISLKCLVTLSVLACLYQSLQTRIALTLSLASSYFPIMPKFGLHHLRVYFFLSCSSLLVIPSLTPLFPSHNSPPRNSPPTITLIQRIPLLNRIPIRRMTRSHILTHHRSRSTTRMSANIHGQSGMRIDCSVRRVGV